VLLAAQPQTLPLAATMDAGSCSCSLDGWKFRIQISRRARNPMHLRAEIIFCAAFFGVRVLF
jgi:hypothetical protein